MVGPEKRRLITKSASTFRLATLALKILVFTSFVTIVSGQLPNPATIINGIVTSVQNTATAAVTAALTAATTSATAATQAINTLITQAAPVAGVAAVAGVAGLPLLAAGALIPPLVVLGAKASVTAGALIIGSVPAAAALPLYAVGFGAPPAILAGSSLGLALRGIKRPGRNNGNRIGGRRRVCVKWMSLEWMPA